MRLVIQRVASANVLINHQENREIKRGLLVLLGIEEEDNEHDIDDLVHKLIQMRIFADADDKMTLSFQDIKDENMIISQFTLFGSTKKGNRPSFIRSAKPDKAIPLYNLFVSKVKEEFSNMVKTGEFGADMQVSLVNDGPVTIIMDSKNKE